MKIVFRTILCFSFIISFTIISSFAATRTWNGGGANNNWSTAANWGGTAPSAGDDLIFAGSTRTSPNNDYAAGTVFNSISFALGASAFTIGGFDFTIAGGAVTANNTSLTMTIDVNVTFTTTTPTISVATGGTLVLNKSVLGTVGFTKTGAGTLTLGNPASAAAQWTGTTTINAGTVNLGQPGGDNYKSLVWIINNGATLKWSTSNIVDNNAVLTVNTGGTINFNNQADAIGNVAGGGSITNIGGSVYLVKPPAGSGSDFSGIASGTGALDAGAGFANLQILSGLNTYTGQTLIQQGTLSINTIYNRGAAASSLGNPTTIGNATIAIGSGGNTGILQYTGTTTSTDRVIDLAGTTGGATLDQSGTGTLTFTSAFTATGAGSKILTLQGSTAGSGIISAAIVNNSGANTTALYKDGTGTWTLSGTNTYTGSTTVNAGTLVLGKANAISSSSNFILSGGTFSTGATTGFSESAGTLTLTGDATIALGTGSHSLHFAASNAAAWTAGRTLSITGWQGSYDCTTGGTSGKIFTGATTELSAAKLAQIGFINPSDGLMYAACQLNTGEIVPSAVVLPVTLISFSGKKVNNSNELNWVTANEINSSYYEILRSSDGINFESIGNINAAGNTSSSSTYVFIDDSPLSGMNYYKLAQYDFNGNSTTSSIIAINNHEEGVFTINALYPNPASEFVAINFESEVAGSYDVILYDELGKELAKIIMEGRIGKNQFKLPLDNYSNGKYFIRIVNPKNESIVSPIIIQH
ncbi:MAG TPA: autotransporter-associated beta strand repeat-containing protein [Cytophagaceae bacterium]|nr:autotransporter-associated beta strand repeat-containing protein [Cytophagaceae bacterium]